MQKVSRINSALWAAYGDALGFITELQDVSTIRKAIDSRSVSETVGWDRRIGGKFGPIVPLPSGCYSDDTQLRLATSRAIRGDGTFDVEAFAKMELPVWLSYFLGAGRGTKAAARNLERRDVTWFSNFFDERASNYLSGGGNGAAMRIQPHIWAESPSTRAAILVDVVKNAVTTHGHPRGFLGAVFHAQCLSHTIETGEMPSPAVWLDITDRLGGVMHLMASDEALDRLWVPTWEKHTGSSLANAIGTVQDELRSDIRAIGGIIGRATPEADYAKILKACRGTEPATRGSGTKTALFSAALSYLFRSKGTKNALVACVNHFGSDTDTIATMAGALLGLTEPGRPDGVLLDSAYIESEAMRLQAISKGEHVSSFKYPDLLHWRTPKTPLDFVGRHDDEIVVAALGTAKPVSPRYSGKGLGGSSWQWFALHFGQTILAKSRDPMPTISSNLVRRIEKASAEKRASDRSHQEVLGQKAGSTPLQIREAVTKQGSLFEPPPTVGPARERRSLNDLTDDVIRSKFDPAVIGRNLRWILDNSRSPIEMAVAFSAIIAKANQRDPSDPG